MTGREEIRFARELLVARVAVEGAGADCQVLFDPPGRDEMIGLGVSAEVAARIADSSWWDEMVEAVLETPDFCEDDASAEEILSVARDTVAEYIAKRY